MTEIKQRQLQPSYSEDEIVGIYRALKEQYGEKPLLYRSFLREAGIQKRDLERMFGSSPYSKLQQLAGDSVNRLELRRTPLSEIMSAYGALASEILENEGRLPVSADWMHRGYSPTESGLRVVHGIRWSEFPQRFIEYCESDGAMASTFEPLVKHIRTRIPVVSKEDQKTEHRFLTEVCKEIQRWSPALRRNSEEAYKSELSLHLRNLAFIRSARLEVREERSDSQCDIAIGGEVALELKKSPSQADYDRCFGQIARHLNQYQSVIVIICDVTRRDTFEDFCLLVDQHFPSRVRVIQNG